MLVAAKGSALAKPCLLVNLLPLPFSCYGVSKLFRKSFVWKVPVENDAKALCRHVPGQPLAL